MNNKDKIISDLELKNIELQEENQKLKKHLSKYTNPTRYKKWYLENQAKIKNYRNEYYQKNQDKIKNYKVDPLKKKEYNKKYYQKKKFEKLNT